MAVPKIEFVAPLIRAALAQLQAEMPGQVALFNAEGNAQVETPATYHFGGQDMLNAYAFPQVEVAAVIGDFGSWGVNRTEVDDNPRVNVAVWQPGGEGDIPALYEQVLGLARCVIECLSPRNAFGAGVEIAQQQGVNWRIDVIPNDPTAHTPDEGRAFQKWLGSALIQFRLETVEHFT